MDEENVVVGDFVGMMLRDINTAVWIWMAIYTFSMYVVGFFLHMHVTMTKKQVVCFLPAIFLWSLAEAYFTCLPSSPFSLIMCNLLELSWLLPTIYLFTDHFALRLIRFSVVSWIANSVALGVLRLYDYKEYMLFTGKHLDVVSWRAIAIFALSVSFIMIIEYPFMKLLFRYRPQLDKLYRAAIVGYLTIVVVDWIVEINAAAHGEFIMRSVIKGLSAVCIVAVIVLLAVLAKRKGLNIKKRQLEKRMDILNSKYDEVAARNRELHKVRHELNKQVEAIYAVEGYVSEEVRAEMTESVLMQRQQLLEGISLSGNLMIDTMLEKHYKELSDNNILLETVLTPVALSKEAEDDILMVQEEMFGYNNRFLKNCEWVRYSIRLKGRSAFILMEMGFKNKKLYNKQRFVDLIGDRMIFRQAFSQTYSIAAKQNGCLDYKLNEDDMEIGVMLNV